MNILFCNEGFIVDGVASYNLYLSTVLKRKGHNVAVIGRWMGPGGFQRRHSEVGVRVIQCPSVTVSNTFLLRAAEKFRPEIIITDARRSFGFALRIREKTHAKIVTVFHDPDLNRNKKNRYIGDISEGSDAWVTPEASIFNDLRNKCGDLPCHHFPRPLTGMIVPSACPPRDPFKVLLLGRLSRWKSPGFKHVVDNALALKAKIPSLQIYVVGGGRRRLNFWAAAGKANHRAKERFVHVVGAKTDPAPWIQESTVVCAGATSAVEALLSGRPTIAFSGFWVGYIDRQNIDYGISSHFGEREGRLVVKAQPEVVSEALIDLYQNWHQTGIETDLKSVGEALNRQYDSLMVADHFDNLFRMILR